MADLDILKDKKFYDYLLQSLTDHRGKLNGFHNNITVRPEFSLQFFANYWLELMKCAGFDYVPLVMAEDHDYQGKLVNGFDSIHRSLSEICESRIDLRLTARFGITGIKLADEEETTLRNLFMLILLFVSEWVADQQEDCPNVTLKQPMARLVYACFSKLFKDIYYGKDEGFKNFIFDENKENSSPSSFISSPNCSFSTSDSSGLNITPNLYPHEENENETIIDIKDAFNDLTKARSSHKKNEEELKEEKKALQIDIDAKVLEFEKNNNKLDEEKKRLEEDLLKAQRELTESTILGIREEFEKQNFLARLQSCYDIGEKLQKEYNSCKNELSGSISKNERLKEKFNEFKDAVKKLEDEKKDLQDKFDAGMTEIQKLNILNNDLINEKNVIHNYLLQVKQELVASKNLVIQKELEIRSIVGQIESLKNENGNLQMERDTCKTAMSEAVVVNDCLKKEISELKIVVSSHVKDNEKVEKEKKDLQQNLEKRRLEIGDGRKQNADNVEEKQTNKILSESSNFQKEEEMRVILECNKLSNNIDKSVYFKKENEELTKAVNRKTRNEEKLEEQKQALQGTLNAKTLELNEAKQLLTRIQAEFLHFLQQLRNFDLKRVEIKKEIDEFVYFFNNIVADNDVSFADLQVLLTNFVAEPFQNISLTNQLETLQDEISSRERNQTQSRHEEDVQTSFNGVALFDGEIVSELLSEPFDYENDDAILGTVAAHANNNSQEISRVPTLTGQENRQRTSCVPYCFILFLLLIIFLTVWIYSFGALFPSWAYIEIHHDQLPPQ